MNDTIKNDDAKHQYVLVAMWTAKDHHGQEQYSHRVVHSTWEGEWDPKGIVERYVQTEHPTWMPDSFGKIGYFMAEAEVELSRVAVYKVVGGRHEDAWPEWLEEARAKRASIDVERERMADMQTIALLQRKWGLGEQTEAKEASAATEEGEAAEA